MIKVAMLWLVNEKDELLLARRADHKKQDPGLWGPSLTGKLETDETYKDALIREADEELGLKPETYEPRFLFQTDFAHPDGEVRQFEVFVAEVPESILEKLVVDTNEVAEVKWQSIPEIKNC